VAKSIRQPRGELDIAPLDLFLAKRAFAPSKTIGAYLSKTKIVGRGFKPRQQDPRHYRGLAPRGLLSLNGASIIGWLLDNIAMPREVKCFTLVETLESRAKDSTPRSPPWATDCLYYSPRENRNPRMPRNCHIESGKLNPN
jgi:hypothetical protein